MEWLLVIAQMCQYHGINVPGINMKISRECRVQLIECVGDHHKYKAEIADKLRECILKQAKGELK